jgi:hypothetical protein
VLAMAWVQLNLLKQVYVQEEYRIFDDLNQKVEVELTLNKFYKLLQGMSYNKESFLSFNYGL